MKPYTKLFKENHIGNVQYTDWSDFKNKINNISYFNSEQELCNQVGMNYNTYTKINNVSMQNWIDSISTSLLHVLDVTHLEIPKPNSFIFKNMLQQTRFLEICKKNNLLMWSELVSAKDNEGKKIQVKNLYMQTIDQNNPTSIHKLNEIIQYIYLYRLYHSVKSKTAKLPKALYRGIRYQNIMNYNSIQELTKEIWKKDSSYEMSRKECYDAVVDHIIENGLSNIIDGPYLSFTSSYTTAKMFTEFGGIKGKGEGFVLKIDPSKVEIVSSELTDPLFKEPNPVSGKKENEYIVNIPSNYIFKKEDIEIIDKDYFIATKNPMCVNLFDHDNLKAIYDLNVNGKNYTIEAKGIWNNRGDKLVLNYEIVNSNNFYKTRKEFMDDHHFDPSVNEKNLVNISNFKIYKTSDSSYTRRNWKEIV